MAPSSREKRGCYRLSLSAVQALGAVVVLLWAASADAATWHLVDQVLIDDHGTRPSVWSGTVAYLNGYGGPVMYYNGSTSVELYPAALHNYEPALAGSVVAWRSCQDDPRSNEILRWNGERAVDISRSPGVIDSDVAVARRGDVMWSQEHQWLMFYDASTGTTIDLNIRGVGPFLYITPTGTVTFVYQDPDTQDVWYFDGSTTRLIGPGLGEQNAHNARAAVWDGAIVWVGPGVGDPFSAGEIFFWKDGQTTRVTNDDAVQGIADDYPCVWNDLVVWQRAAADPMQPRIFLWDGTDTTPLTTKRTQYPSFDDGWLAWVDYTAGLCLARIVRDGDCNHDQVVDAVDFAVVAGCFTGPDAGPVPDGCECGDLNGDTDVDLADFAAYQVLPED
jgi:hypothetical protein